MTNPNRRLYKMQLPVSHFGPGKPACLVYSQSRTDVFQMDITPSLKRVFGTKKKIFVYGCVNHAGFTYESEHQPDPGW